MSYQTPISSLVLISTKFDLSTIVWFLWCTQARWTLCWSGCGPNEEAEGCLGWIKVTSTRTRWQKKIRWISLVHKLDVPRFNSVAPNRRIVVSTEGVPRPQKLAFIAHWLLSILHRLQAITSTDAGIKKVQHLYTLFSISVSVRAARR